MNTPDKIRLSLDVSERARRNLKLFAAAAGLSMSDALDEILTRHMPGIAGQQLGAAHVALYEDEQPGASA